MTDFSVPGALSKSFEIEKNYRAHKVFTEYDRYRKRFFDDINDTINNTDYLVEIANETEVKKYLRQTPPRKRTKLPNVDLTPEIIERFKNSNMRTEKSATYNPKLAAKLLADTKKYTFRMAPINRAAVSQKRVDRYPIYHPKSIKDKSPQFIYFSENANSDQSESIVQFPSKYSNISTLHQNTDESSIDNNSNSFEEEILLNISNFNQNNDETNDEQNDLDIKTSEARIIQAADEILKSISRDATPAPKIEDISADEPQQQEEPSPIYEEEEEILSDKPQQQDEPSPIFEEEEEMLSDKPQQQEEPSPTFEEEEEILSIDEHLENKYDFELNDVTLDTRPSNCGNSPDGSADFVMAISGPKFLEHCSTKYGVEFPNLISVPQEEYEIFRTLKFNWIYFRELPHDTNIRSLTALLHLAHLLIVIDYDEFIDPSYADGIIFKESITDEIRTKYKNKLLIGPDPSNFTDYYYDERPINYLRNKDPISFMKCIQEGGIEKQRKAIRLISTKGLSFNERSEITAAAMLLTLPGMKIIDFNDTAILEKLHPLLNQTVIWNGVFEYVDFLSNGNLCSWKYSRGKDHLLIAANFAIPQNTAHIICNDCPEVKEGEKNVFVDILTETKYFRDPIELKTKGLCVILYEYEAQIFEY